MAPKAPSFTAPPPPTPPDTAAPETNTPGTAIPQNDFYVPPPGPATPTGAPVMDVPLWQGPGTPIGADDWKQELPEEIARFLEDNHVCDSRWTCHLYRFINESMSGPGTLLQEYIEHMPTFDQIAMDFGIGHYRLQLRYGKQTRQKKNIDTHLSGSHYEELANMASKNRDETRRKELERKAEEQRILYGNHPPPGPQADPLDTLGKAITVMAPLISGGRMGGGSELAQILPLIMQQSQQNMQLMMESQKNSTAIMIAMLQGQRGIQVENNQANREDAMMDRVLGLLEKTGRLQAMFSPKEETAIDKVFTFLATMGEALLPILAKPREQRLADPRVQMVAMAGRDWIDTIKSNPDAIEELENRLAKKFKREDVEEIIDTFAGDEPLEADKAQPARGGQVSQEADENLKSG